MIIWLASYPRSGNTLFRVLLHSVFGFQTHSVYSVAGDVDRMPDDNHKLMRLVGQEELECDIGTLRADSARHFVKTHDLPSDDNFPAVVVIRDGRDAAVSYAHFVLKTEQGIELPSRDLFDATLKQIITGDQFGGWSKNVNAWVDRAPRDTIIRYEELIEDPVNIVAAVLRRLGVNSEMDGAPPPSFQELHATVPWFFRKGKSGSWCEEMPSYLHDLFLERHGDTLLRLGYSDRISDRGMQERWSRAEACREARPGVIEDLSRQLQACKADRGAHLSLIEDLSAKLSISEADRAARLQVIHELSSKAAALEDECRHYRKTLEALLSSPLGRLLRLLGMQLTWPNPKGTVGSA